MVLIVICGATATGKSGLALKLAQRFDAAIISADSRQVYRDFDIGTAKPTQREQQQVPHFLIDVCEPTETFTVAEYQQQAQRVIEQLHQSGRVGEWESGRVGSERVGEAEVHPSTHRPVHPSTHRLIDPSTRPPVHPSTPLLVGGTGLYIRSITQGLQIPHVPPQLELRSQLKQLGQKQCYAFLQQVDRASAEKVHPHDEVRTLRALEVFYTTGKPLSQQQGEHPPSYPILHIGLDCGLDCRSPSPDSGGAIDPLTRRIEQRTQQMIAAGFVDEVEGLCRRYGADLPLLNTLGYAEIKRYLAGELALPEAIAQVVVHTRQFAKRQRTWFRANPSIEWFDADSPHLLENVWERVQRFFVDVGNSGS